MSDIQSKTLHAHLYAQYKDKKVFVILQTFVTFSLTLDSVPYGHFDILKDEEIRQGLKTYSDWPTYPQLYVKGELIGGMDIVKVSIILLRLLLLL